MCCLDFRIWSLDHRVKSFSFLFIFFFFLHFSSLSLFFFYFFYFFFFVLLLCLLFFVLLLCHLVVPCAILNYYLVALSCYFNLLLCCATSSHYPIVLPRVASLFHCVALHVCFIVSWLHHIASLLRRAAFLLHCQLTSLPSFVALPTTIAHYLTSLPLFTALFITITCYFVHCYRCHRFVALVI